MTLAVLPQEPSEPHPIMGQTFGYVRASASRSSSIPSSPSRFTTVRPSSGEYIALRCRGEATRRAGRPRCWLSSRPA
jgi:hypothetical protein